MRTAKLPCLPLRNCGDDGLQRPTSVTSPARSPQPEQRFADDGLGRRTSRALGAAIWLTAWASGAATTAVPGGVQVTDDRLVATQEWGGETTAYGLYADGRRRTEKRFANAWPVDVETTAGATKEWRYEYQHGLGALTGLVDVGGSETTTYEVDEEGRTTKQTEGGVSTAYGFDTDGRLVSATRPGLTAAYEYDALGLRRRATVTTTPPTGPPSSSTRSWVWGDADGEEEVGEEDADGVQLTARVAGFVVGQGVYRFQHDGLGSVIRQTSAGLDATAQYTAFGTRSGSVPTAVGFTGHRVEEALGLSYAEQRWLDSRTGLFRTVDPVFGDIHRPESLMTWGYANGNPMRFVDLDGREISEDPLQVFAEGLSDMFQVLIGGKTVNPCAGTGETGAGCRGVWAPPKAMPGGLVGGALREASLRELPVEKDATEASRAGMEVGGGLVPLVGPAQRMATGETVTGQPLEWTDPHAPFGLGDRTIAAIEFVADAAPIVAEAVEAEKALRLEISTAKVIKPRLRSKLPAKPSLLERLDAWVSEAMPQPVVQGAGAGGPGVSMRPEPPEPANVVFTKGNGKAEAAAPTPSDVKSTSQSGSGKSQAGVNGGAKAASAVAAPAKSGETTATKAGKAAHKNYGTALGGQYETEVTLPSGKRADAVHKTLPEVRELKPDNPRAIRKGQKQVDAYAKELEANDPLKRAWRGVVDTYTPPKKP